MYTRVSVVGLGYIGLPTAVVLASQGVEVVGVDVNENAVSMINGGKAHIVEPDLDARVKAVVSSGKLRATSTPEKAQAFILAVPTPFKDGGVPDLSYIESAARSIAPQLEKGNLVILESTSPVGTTEKLAGWLSDARPDLSFPGLSDNIPDVNICYCPERVLPGYVLKELVENDRIIGGLTADCSVRAGALYKIFVKGQLLMSDSRTAEMAKLTENAYRDVNIAFANELSIICDKIDVNVWELIRLANRHPRVNILQPGPGVGGHCIAVDPWFIVHSAPEEAKLIACARAVNDGKPAAVVEKVKKAAEKLKNPVIACLGLAYKADIDDLRESPAVGIVELLVKDGTGELMVVEPHVKDLPERLSGLPGVKHSGMESAIKKADIVLLLVDHSVFRKIPYDSLRDKVVIDTRGIFN